MSYDHIVIGIGAMGAATLHELARRGDKVLGLEQFDIPHNFGSSHGLTRVIRLAYNEHPNYVPLLRRAYEMWRQLETDVAEQLLVMTGGLDIGAETGRVVTGALDACRQHELPHEVMTAKELRARYPGFAMPDDFAAVYQPDAGYLRPERCIVAHVTEAMKMGAEIHGREFVLDWRHGGGVFKVTTSAATYEAPSLVVTAGAWAAKLVTVLGANAQPQRQVVGWFQPLQPALFDIKACPVFILDVEEGLYYGFPVDKVPGFKLGRFYHRGEDMDPDAPRRDIDAADEEVLRSVLRRYFPQANGPTMALQDCIFTLTPDRHFIMDLVRDVPGLTLGAGFSGHGFKFACVVGEIMADLAQSGATKHDIDMFSLARFDGVKG